MITYERIMSAPPIGVDVPITVSTIVLPVNHSRRYARITNDSDTVVYLALNDTAELNKGIRLDPNG